MLTRLKVTNFKALRNIDLALRERNVFIGPNKSGKSSILHVLSFLTQSIASGDVSRYFGGDVGFQQFLWKGLSKGTIRVEVSGDDRPLLASEKDPVEFRYAIEVGPDAVGNISISSELLTVTEKGTTSTLVETNMGRGIARRLSGEIVFENPESKTKPFLAYEVPGWEADQIRKYILRWTFYSLLPELPRFQAAQAAAQTFLDQNGAQLSSWLHTFQANHPDSFRRVIAAAKEAFPEIEFIAVPVTQAGTTFISTTEKGLVSPVPIFYASDGEIKFLQLLSIIFSPFPVSLVAVEEPEDRLHPRLLELLVQTADRIRVEEATEPVQALVTTHSPYLVDLLRPEDVVLVEKREGATRCTRAADKRDLHKLLEEGELSFGRLWYSGALGGV